MSLPVSPSLLTRLLRLAGHLDAAQALAELVSAAADHTGAKYAAIASIDAFGETTEFHQRGIDEETAAVLGRPPRGHGVLGALPDDGVLLLEDLTAHPDFGGFPPGHPPMHAFLGVNVTLGGEVLGRLYLAEKDGGFTDQDVETVQLLAAAAAVAIDNAQLYDQAQRREKWLEASQEITTMLLEGSEEEDVLQLVARRTREAADADAAVIVLPSVEDWVVEIVEGAGAASLLGQQLPTRGPAIQTVRSGVGRIVESISRQAASFVPPARRFERALYAPLRARGSQESTTTVGILILFRNPGRVPFTQEDLEIAHDFGSQAALALRLAAARHAEDVASLLSERNRIARDLHDLAIQQLFATGMRLERARSMLASSATAVVHPTAAQVHDEIEEAIDGVDEAVRQIRGIVRSLRDRDEQLPVVERLVREASLARASLGYAPSMLLTLDGRDVSQVDAGDEDATEIDARLGEQLGDDVVAVVREGLSNVARHAAATSARVEVQIETRTVQVIVTDDGRGPDPEVDRRSGLANLVARAEEHDGAARLSPVPEGGSRLVWEAWIG
ncbi:GAF domain-containing sensor histidine kinase [Serinibacter salmoneus]|uniref:Signal transduction histidine kinase n=1 Tax=Serinibacter salmoneus TaxID=556530 RepID=A0A2A9D1J3_9MICO|nr:GAF domain-containing protein [Serinibacter salmoneus]PFG20125.1 signal transduction histidine kinase [Serinibacter salmoneus]